MNIDLKQIEKSFSVDLSNLKRRFPNESEKTLLTEHFEKYYGLSIPDEYTLVKYFIGCTAKGVLSNFKFIVEYKENKILVDYVTPIIDTKEDGEFIILNFASGGVKSITPVIDNYLQLDCETLELKVIVKGLIGYEQINGQLGFNY